MAESSSQKTSSSEIIPKEEPVTRDKPKSLNPFLPAVSDFVSKFYLKEASTRALNEYKEYLSEVWYTTKTLDDSKVWISSPRGGVRGEIGITTFRNALRAQYLPHSSGKIGGLDQILNKDANILYCLANGVQVDYAKIIWEDLIHKLNKKTREKIVPYPRFISLLLEYIMPEYDNKELTINPTQGMDEGTKNHSFDHIFAGSNLSVLVDTTKSARDGLKTANTYSGANKESRADDISLKVKLEDLLDILKDTRSAFFTPDSPPGEPIIVSDESEEEEEVARDKDIEATSHDVPKDTSEELEQAKAKSEAEVTLIKAKPSYPGINQLTKLLLISLKPDLSKLLASHDFASCLLTELKELPSKITGLSGEIKELKKHVRDMEIEFPGDLKEIPTKLEAFTSTISSPSSQVAELKNIHWELPTEFATMVENASGATSMNVPLACKAIASLVKGEKNTKDADTNLKDELVDLLGKNVVTRYYTKKLLFDKYCDKMLKRKKSPKITKCEVLTKKGHITLKIYREDRSDEVISNLKVSGLHSGEWREVMQACPDKSEKG
ncbi:hypothetical protein Tco_1285088 [Tanacetum coccineum]